MTTKGGTRGPSPAGHLRGRGDLYVEGRFLDRPNRFLARAELSKGEVVEAHLPNTGRLLGLLAPDSRIILRREESLGRRTRFTLTRVWDGTWVSLEAARAPEILARWLLTVGELPSLGPVTDVEREVAVLGHRLDLRLVQPGGGAVWLEVKSGSRAMGDTALLSGTPSLRGIGHLQVLEVLVRRGEAAACAFVVQRGDVKRLVVGSPADPAWIEGVESAHRNGVTIIAFSCRVTPGRVEIARPLPVDFSAP